MTPDIRWKARFRKVSVAIDELEARLRELIKLDNDNKDAIWQDYGSDALGCLEGIRVLTDTADGARTGAIAKRMKELQAPAGAKETP
jgi:hypothetical protein